MCENWPTIEVGFESTVLEVVGVEVVWKRMDWDIVPGIVPQEIQDIRLISLLLYTLLRSMAAFCKPKKFFFAGFCAAFLVWPKQCTGVAPACDPLCDMHQLASLCVY